MEVTENYFMNRLPKVSDEEAMECLRKIMEWELPETYKVLGVCCVI